MKRIALILSLLVLISCNKDDNKGDVITNEFEQIQIILPQGKWKVTSFYSEHADHTIDFETFIFSFNEDGTVNGKTDLFSEDGTWLYKTTSENGEQLILQFSGTPPFDKITENWTIVSLNVSKIELTHKIGNNDDNTKLLTFSKI